MPQSNGGSALWASLLALGILLTCCDHMQRGNRYATALRNNTKAQRHQKAHRVHPGSHEEGVADVCLKLGALRNGARHDRTGRGRELRARTRFTLSFATAQTWGWVSSAVTSQYKAASSAATMCMLSFSNGCPVRTNLYSSSIVLWSLQYQEH